MGQVSCNDLGCPECDSSFLQVASMDDLTGLAAIAQLALVSLPTTNEVQARFQIDAFLVSLLANQIVAFRINLLTKTV